MGIPYTLDLIQQHGEEITDVPEIRVWCHPHKIGKQRDKYFRVFKTFTAALNFISKHKEADDTPLIAFKGFEIDIFGIKTFIERYKETHYIPEI